MAALANQQRLEAIQGVVERLTFHSPESGYSVARLKLPGEQDESHHCRQLPQYPTGADFEAGWILA